MWLRTIGLWPKTNLEPKTIVLRLNIDFEPKTIVLEPKTIGLGHKTISLGPRTIALGPRIV